MTNFRDLLHSTYGSQLIDPVSCFLCGDVTEDLTEEHVFPRWLQKKYRLETQALILLNGTSIHYKKLRVPCCKSCNGGYLSRLESQVATAISGGYQASIGIDSLSWYFWAGKIFYSILRKEYELIFDRRSPAKGNITNSETLKGFSNLHLFLQGIRDRHSFSGDAPFTVLVCNLHDLGEGRNFGFIDDFLHFSIAIRMGETGVIVCFQDCGLVSSTYAKYVSEVNGRKLHPLQFDELYAKVSYQLHLLDGVPLFLTSASLNGDSKAITESIPRGRVREWDQEEFAECLFAHISDWFHEERSAASYFEFPDRVVTWMTDKDGAPLLLPLDDWEGQLPPT